MPALDVAQLGFHVTPHGMRHAHASWLLAGGADLQVVKERLGHGSISTTGKYLHTMPNVDEVALKALAAIRGRSDSAEGSIGGSEAPQLADVVAMMAKIKDMYDQMTSP
jgi:hypothetical protein